MVAQPGAVLMVLAPSGQRRVVLEIDERNLSLLKMEQPARISADAYPDKTFTGVVSFIKPSVDSESGSFEVRLDVAEPPDYVKEGMTVSVDVEVARHPQALVLPLNVIRDASTAKPHVLVIVDGRAADRPVTLGVKGTEMIEILDGLKEGDLVVPVALTAVTAGDKVRSSLPEQAP
jgi:HlyD family secretion protein